MRKNRQREIGFTIVELLATITIISIMSALLLPVLGSAREKGREISCLSNLKQIGIAVELYTQDYEGWAPTCTDYVTLNSYLNNSDVFWCPSSGTDRKWDGQGAPAENEGVSYGFNSNGTGNDSGFCSVIPNYRNLKEMSAPEQLIVGADSFHDMSFEFLAQYSPDDFGPGDIHHGGSNVLFADGHVRWRSLDYLKTTIHIWNRDNSDIDYGL